LIYSAVMPSAARYQRIYIVGFMGAGKSSVGESLARELGYAFLDLDREIERADGREIAEIFRQDGERVFRRLEAAALRRAGARSDVVVACGGGTLTLWENRDFIAQTGVCVWLDAPLDLMLERCGGGARRPLLGDRPTMERLLAERLPAYRQADLRVDAAAGDPEAIASRIASSIVRSR